MIKISGARLKEKLLIKKIEKATFAALGQQNFFVVDMIIASEQEIRTLNRDARGVDAVTDVLSFPCFEGLKLPIAEKEFVECDYDGNKVVLGSIMICRERALEQAQEFAHSYARELGFLACHGFLHLLGFDHILPDDEEKMTSKQREIMSAIGLQRV